MNTVIKTGADNIESGLTFINTGQDDPINVKFVTPYASAWSKYILSAEYKASVEEMIKHGMKQPYVNNILQESFSAGWNSKNRYMNAISETPVIINETSIVLDTLLELFLQSVSRDDKMMHAGKSLSERKYHKWQWTYRVAEGAGIELVKTRRILRNLEREGIVISEKSSGVIRWCLKEIDGFTTHHFKEYLCRT
jgi:hypothetical protein